MTLEQMREQVVRWLGLQEITSLNEGDIVEGLLYDGTVDLLSRTRCVVRCIELRVLAGEDQYLLDHQVLSLVEVEDGARKLRRNETGIGFTLIRSDVLRISPAPSEDGELQVWAVKRPQRMTADTDSPSFEQFGAIPDEFQDAIVTYALWKAADYADDVPAQNGDYYRQLYEGPDGRGGRLSQIRVLVNKRGTARGSRMQVNLRPVSGSGAYT